VAKKQAKSTGNEYWDQFIPPQPVAQPKPVQQPVPTADILRPAQPAPVIAPAPAPSNPWLPLYTPPPPQPQYVPVADVLRPTTPPIQAPQPAPQNPWLPMAQPNPVQPVQAPSAWRPELIQTGFAPPDIGAPQIEQSGTFSPTIASSLNNFNQAVVQGPQPRPANYNLYLNQPSRTPQQQGWGASSTGLVNQAFDTAINFINDDPFMRQNGYQLSPFSESAASRQMDYYNQQLDERRPYGTGGVWDMWQQVQEGAGQIGQAFSNAFQDTGSTPTERLNAAKQFGAELLGGVLNIADAPRDTAIGYDLTAPLVGAVNASQATQRYAATREVG